MRILAPLHPPAADRVVLMRSLDGLSNEASMEMTTSAPSSKSRGSKGLRMPLEYRAFVAEVIRCLSEGSTGG